MTDEIKLGAWWKVNAKKVKANKLEIVCFERDAAIAACELLRTRLALAESVCEAASNAFRLIEDKYCHVPDGKQRESTIFGIALAAWRTTKSKHPREYP